MLGALKESGVPPRALVFEITETALISKMAVAEALVRKLREIECQIALNDSGSGLSSFQDLRKSPVGIKVSLGQFYNTAQSRPCWRAVVRSTRTAKLIVRDLLTSRHRAEMPP
ncbi:EAL domain-containing protein [Microvirga calopogonii]|uniref:EAL domain-containing protein n=1 Tax=Microvirga calopogonii TaxID=2078013 RepID=UPI003CCAF164